MIRELLLWWVRHRLRVIGYRRAELEGIVKHEREVIESEERRLTDKLIDLSAGL